MQFSLHDHLKGLDVDLKGRRLEMFKRALELDVQKRDILWLQRLKYSQSPAAVEVPDGWKVMADEFHDAPVRKHEKSVFYFLQHALYSGAFYRKMATGETLVLPSFPSNFWPFLLIHVEAGATVSIHDDYALVETGDTPFRSVMVFAGENSEVTWRGYEHHDETVLSFDHKWFHLAERARLDFFQNVVGGDFSYDEAVVELMGRGSQALSQSVFLGNGKQRQEMRVNHVHVGQDTLSTMVSKGAVKGESHGVFLGMIQMEPGCDGADGYLEEHNLLLSDRAKIDAVPGLEIGHHNVKAGHAATMERVDEEKLFYLASRGIPKAEAIELILEGFFLDALQKMKDPTLEQRVFDHMLALLHS